MLRRDHIRNFAIIAHIDHGKSTLADRLLEATGTVARRDMTEQMLDSNPIERERGITIKLAPVRMIYQIPNPNAQITKNPNRLGFGASDLGFSDSKQEFVLNLIDTPGHVDFSYEVSRSLAACEGAILVVDATQGVQAQTLANLHLAEEHNLVIIPVINKIDLPNARVEETSGQLVSLGFQKEDILTISAKLGTHIPELLDSIVTRIPAPGGSIPAQLRALVFSSQYDTHKGVIVFVRVVDGSIDFDPSLRLHFMASGAGITPIEVGYFTPRMTRSDHINTGEVGYIATGLKDARMAKVGDTITSVEIPNPKSQITNNTKDLAVPLPGYQEPKPMVFLGLFPLSSDDISSARDAMEKLRLADSAFTFRPISSLALGNGFHCGFLGLLHAEIVQERIFREFGLSMIATAPSVEYRLTIRSKMKFENEQLVDRNLKMDKSGDQISDFQPPLPISNIREPFSNSFSIQSAAEYPDPSQVESVEEPVMKVTIFSPKQYVGAVMQLSQEKRGVYLDMSYLGDQVKLTYSIPLSEMIIDFFDRLKAATEGYASLDYAFFDYQPVSLVKVDILVNKEKVDALSFLMTASEAGRRSREIVERLAAVIPRAQFQIPVQAAIGGQVIARADVKSFRKDVIQKLYGGDRTRKDKLLEAQKKGKARMKMVGKVAIPQSAFFAVLKHI
ncbi:elongation factor 4 [Patescibacteria group bacterium]|nr:elongation factor 4 [Patescibacteria group bacterium]